MYNQLKVYNGQKYSGMSVGGSHHWHYLNAEWLEKKVKPDEWDIRFTAVKRRHNPAPQGSGAGIGTGYHWFIVADQVVKKLDKDSYQTEMIGKKFKVGHKRPYWRKWSYEYPQQKPYKQQVIDLLKRAIEQLEKEV